MSNYANYNQLYCSDLNPAVEEETIKQELEIASMWFSHNNLVLNPEKCKAMVISNNSEADDSIFEIDGPPVTKVESLVLLGIVIEKSLFLQSYLKDC